MYIYTGGRGTMFPPAAAVEQYQRCTHRQYDRDDPTPINHDFLIVSRLVARSLFSPGMTSPYIYNQGKEPL